MREIKFRGYAKEELVGSQWIDNGYGVTRINYTDGTSSVHLLTPYGDYRVEEDSVGQYTGLKDKNGKEIYEGDILSYKKIIYTNCSMEEIEEIKDEVLIELINYRPIASIVKPLSKGVECFGYDNVNNECLILDLQSEELEVVGNIYENPELLK